MSVDKWTFNGVYKEISDIYFGRIYFFPYSEIKLFENVWQALEVCH